MDFLSEIACLEKIIKEIVCSKEEGLFWFVCFVVFRDTSVSLSNENAKNSP